MKRFLSVFLSLVLIFTCSSVVFAEEAEPLSAEEIAAMIDSGELKLDLVSMDDFYEKTTAVTIGDRSISPAMLNYSYITQYYSFLTTYGAYAANFGLNTSLGVSSLAGQACPMINGGTWQDYFLSAAVDSLLMNTALSRYAEENGIALTDEEKATALAGLEELEETAVANGFESGEAFLKATYGSGVTPDLLQEVSLDFALASKKLLQMRTVSIPTKQKRLRKPEQRRFTTNGSPERQQKKALPLLPNSTVKMPVPIPTAVFTML